MEDIFRSYWWLLFPLGFMLIGAFNSFLTYRRQQETLKLIKTYADKGQEPPPALLKVLEQPIDDDKWSGGGRSPAGEGSWFTAILFGVMALGFGYGASTDMYGAGPALVIVTFVLAGIALACLFQAIRAGRRPRD